MRFRKMHGLGNDFVIFDAREENIFLTPEDMRLIADRRLGVGCDLIAVLDKSAKADVAAYYFNSDGSQSGACGNASRCIADIIMSESGKDECSIEVTYGVLNCKKRGDLLVEVDMGSPNNISEPDLSKGNVSSPVAVDMGNPHLVFFVDNLADIDVQGLGAYFENHEMFPERTNVEFVQVIDKTRLRQKTWERGVGVTLACGSGACAVMAAARRKGFVDGKVDIELDGGVLNLELRESDNHLLMCGAVTYVFEGELYE